MIPSAQRAALEKIKEEAGQGWIFFQQWLRDPLGTASVVPSGQRLGRAMARAVPTQARTIVELGAGTGAITRALLSHGFDPKQLLVLELNEALHAGLCHRFPEAHVRCADARKLPEIVGSTPGFAVGGVGAVVSSLGLLSMPRNIVAEIVDAAFQVLATDGCFVQFTYGPKAPVPKEVMTQLGLRARRVDFTLLNVPPASVYVIER